MPRSLYIYSVFYGGMVCIAGVLGNKQVALGPLAVEAGIFPFLLLVVTSSAVAELHGRDHANALVRYGFIPLIGSILLSLIVLNLPPSPKMAPESLAAFNTILGQTWRIWGAGILAYGVSQTLNVWLFDRLRSGTGKWVAVRGAIAAALSQIVDTFIFVFVAFYGQFPIGPLLGGQMLAKVVLSLLIVPFVIQLMVGLGRSLDRTPASA